MSTASFNGLLIISVIAVMAPVLAASAKRLKLPSVVVEITAGIIVGPSVLAGVKIDQPVNVVALLCLAFLLFGQAPSLSGQNVAQLTTPAQAADLIDSLRTAGVILTYDPDQQTLRCPDHAAVTIGNDR